MPPFESSRSLETARLASHPSVATELRFVPRTRIERVSTAYETALLPEHEGLVAGQGFAPCECRRLMRPIASDGITRLDMSIHFSILVENRTRNLSVRTGALYLLSYEDSR